ncbi:CBS domain-containing protein [Streptomyces fradiae]|uniref:CBS domain-containing protein n=1 Tax=Streptomyces fradiae TaxID=1906 RepID=UPI0036B21237
MRTSVVRVVREEMRKMVGNRTVGDVMTGEVVQARPDTSVGELARLLTVHRISGLPVVDEDDKVVGVVSQTDLTRRQAAAPRGAVLGPRRVLRALGGIAGRGPAAAPRTAGGLMTSPAVTVHRAQGDVDAARLMERRRIDRLPVVDEEDRLIGITTRRDLLRVFLRSDEEILADVARALRAGSPAAPAVSVEVGDGVVTLAGSPPPGADTAAWVLAAWQVDGVIGVTSRLTAGHAGRGAPAGDAMPAGGAMPAGRLAGGTEAEAPGPCPPRYDRERPSGVA